MRNFLASNFREKNAMLLPEVASATPKIAPETAAPIKKLSINEPL